MSGKSRQRRNTDAKLSGTSEDFLEKETRQIIREAFIACLEDTPYERVTVSQITQQAGLSRKAFYYHFADKTDLMKQICLEDIRSFENETVSDGPSALTELVRFFIDSNRVLYGNALQDMSPGSFGQFFADVLFYQISGRLKKSYLQITGSRTATNLAIAQQVETARLLTIFWLLDPSEPCAEDLIRYLYTTQMAANQTIGRWLEKEVTRSRFPDAPLQRLTEADYSHNMIHEFTVQESFDLAMDNAMSKTIASERQSIEHLLWRYRR